MNIFIRKFEESDRTELLKMMEVFYSSEAVSTNGSKEIFNKDFDACVGDNPFLEGFMLIVADKIAGYAVLAKSFSTEFGKNCIWLEDLYLKPNYRGMGIISNFIKFVDKNYPQTLLKLEVEEDNFHAVHVYKKSGFQALPYVVMKKEL